MVQAEPPGTPRRRACACILSLWTLKGPVPIPSSPTWVTCILTDVSCLQNPRSQLPTHHSHHCPHTSSFTVRRARCCDPRPTPHTAQTIPCSLQDVARDQSLGVSLHCHLEHGDSVVYSHPFLVAAPNPMSASKTVPLCVAPKSVPFLGRNATVLERPGYHIIQKPQKHVLRSYSECLSPGLKCEQHVDRVRSRSVGEPLATVNSVSLACT